jgi:hypothetical protein
VQANGAIDNVLNESTEASISGTTSLGGNLCNGTAC